LAKHARSRCQIAVSPSSAAEQDAASALALALALALAALKQLRAIVAIAWFHGLRSGHSMEQLVTLEAVDAVMSQLTRMTSLHQIKIYRARRVQLTQKPLGMIDLRFIPLLISQYET
jgi:hypothetical protein